MDAREPDSFVDDLLDAALERRRSAEPTLGLEGRILAKLRARPRGIPLLASRRLEWVAGLAAVLAVGATALYTTRRATAPFSPTRPTIATGPEPLAASPALPSLASNRPTPRHRRDVKGASPQQASRLTPPEPRLERFPAPGPLSDQERLVLKLVQSTPEPPLMAQIDRVGMQPLRIDALTIAELEIKELASPENGEAK